MLEPIRYLQKEVITLQKEVGKVTSRQVNSIKIVDLSKKVVDFYFQIVKKEILKKYDDVDICSHTDELFQKLLNYTYRYPTAKKYREVLASIKDSLIELEKVALIENPDLVHKILDERDKRIIETLDKLIPTASLSYEQALIDINIANRKSWRGPATELRESLRECLDYFAPDKDVSLQPGFKLEPETKGPTMKQKVKYIMNKRSQSKGAIKASEDAVTNIEDSFGGFVRSVYTRASISTHTLTDIHEVKRIKNMVSVVLSEILEIS